MADPTNSKDGQALVNKLAEMSTNMRQAANLADAFAQSLAQMFPGIVVAPQPAVVTGKKRGRVPKEGKKIKDPNAPKRPATSYIMFQNDVRDDLRQKNPGVPYKGKLISFTVFSPTNSEPLELLGKVSEAWQSLAEDQKKQYQDAADVNMAKYNRAVLDYKGAANGHAPVPVVVATPEADEEEEEEEEEEELPTPKKQKATPAPVAESSEEESEVGDSESEPTPAPPPVPVKKTKAKATAPPSSGKEKKKAKK
ncbi:hypothetical protein BDV93DRAFT_605979 [Ceratobasidium sp. AG-I]|nr:hypothetical protein BDV93DRAFT_605979 [Ceratobasidium sp. AG-I]